MSKHLVVKQAWCGDTRSFCPYNMRRITKFVAENPLSFPEKDIMVNRHRNKTLSTLLAMLFGSVGAHRFYLYGKKDVWGWLSVLAFVLLYIATVAQLPQAVFITFLTFVAFAFFAGLIGALVIGLTPDEKWDSQHNAASGRLSNSGWAVILLVILTFALGSTALIATIARSFDLFLTGGAFG